MFLPKGSPVHENLATIYVLVDALVDDLCDGGFSGDIEIVLRDRDVHIILDKGKIAATVEIRDHNSLSNITITEIAALARRERGRISVYHYSHELADALASRALARPLYSHLSTDFADLEKMISKLARERARQWFVDVSTASGTKAIVQIKDGQSHVIASYDEATGQSASNQDMVDTGAMSRLLEECNRAGGTFDVYFAAAATLYHPPRISGFLNQEQQQLQQTSEPAPDDANTSVASTGAGVATEDNLPDVTPAQSESEVIETHDSPAPVDDDSNRQEIDNLTAKELSVIHETLPGPSDSEQAAQAEMMIEIKRFMGEMARVIDIAGQEIDQRDTFSIKLRAGQIKITDRYPFLDPFGSEFEYLAGEIAFIGDAPPQEFVAGLTEALKLAFRDMLNSSAQPGRLRATVALELRSLLDRNREEMERLGLDQSIHELVG